MQWFIAIDTQTNYLGKERAHQETDKCRGAAKTNIAWIHEHCCIRKLSRTGRERIHKRARVAWRHDQRCASKAQSNNSKQIW